MSPIPEFKIYTRAEVEAMSESEKVEHILRLQEVVLHLVGVCEALRGQNETLVLRCGQLERRVKELEERLNQNSRNSSKPPSSDGPAKPVVKNLREKTGRKPGGQPNHPGATLRQVQTPGHIRRHAPAQCACGHGLAQEPVIRVERYQVFDVPEPRMAVTEHQVEVKRCPGCGRACKGALPPDVAYAPVQYGPRVMAMLVYLRVYQLLPYERLSELCRDLFGFPVSKASIEAAEAQVDGHLPPFVDALTQRMARAEVLHADETGFRVEGHTRWLHVLATETLTLYQVHDQRGREAMEAQGVLPRFGGTLIHDCWGPYFQYNCLHGLCNAHLLRELKFAHEEQGQAWAFDLYMLLEILCGLKTARADEPFSEEAIASFEAMYDGILARGCLGLPADPPKTGRRGRAKKSKARNLHERLLKHRDAALRFVHDPQVPFTNNLAEQAVRMAKVQQKISGCMRTLPGAQRFARLRSYVSTLKKHGMNILRYIADAAGGCPWLPCNEAGPG
jgi:transposase